MNGDEYKQLFGMIENVQSRLGEQERREAGFHSEVLARLNSLRCSEHSGDMDGMRTRLVRVEMGMAAARPWANLLMAAIGGGLVALISHVIKV